MEKDDFTSEVVNGHRVGRPTFDARVRGSPIVRAILGKEGQCEMQGKLDITTKSETQKIPTLGNQTDTGQLGWDEQGDDRIGPHGITEPG